MKKDNIHGFPDFFRKVAVSKRKLFIYSVSVILISIIVSLLFAIGSSMMLFLVSLAFVPILFYIAEDIKDLKDILRWWKHFLIIIATFIIIYSAFILITPVQRFDSIFETQWEVIVGHGVNMEFDHANEVFVDIFFNNILVLAKIVMLSIFFGIGGLFLVFYTTSYTLLLLISFFIEKRALLFSGKALLISSFILLKYAPHYILEMSGFIVAGVASVKLIHNTLFSEEKNIPTAFEKSLPLFLKFMAFAVVLILVAAAFEAYIDLWLADLAYIKEFSFVVSSDPTMLLQ